MEEVSVEWIPYLIQLSTRPKMQKCTKNLHFFLHVFPKNFFGRKLKKNCSGSCIVDTSCTCYFIGNYSQFHHYQTCLFTVLHISLICTVILKSSTKQYAGTAHCRSISEQSDVLLGTEVRSPQA